jgi:hypothetical protein
MTGAFVFRKLPRLRTDPTGEGHPLSGTLVHGDGVVGRPGSDDVDPVVEDEGGMYTGIRMEICVYGEIDELLRHALTARAYEAVKARFLGGGRMTV